MSASPAGQTPGRTPNGGGPKVIRRPRKADPLMQPKQKKRAMPATQANGVIPGHSNGTVANANGSLKNMPHHLGRPTPPPPTLAKITAGSGIRESGFSARGLNPSNFTDYPLVTTKRALMEGLRHHVVKFAGKAKVDPSDDKEFTRPVRLHRRDPRLPPGGAGGIKEEEEDGLPAEERERRDRERAEKDAQRAADAAQIAPSADKGAHQRKIPFGKKVQTVYRNDQNETKKAQSKLRYEEALPWHLEDFDNKSIWVGNYEDALSHQYAALAHGEDGKFRMIPLEKWYKFTPKPKVKTYTAEEADKKMKAQDKPDRWAAQIDSRRETAFRERMHTQVQRGLYVGNTKGDEGIKTEQVDELDFEEDMFADDEETPFIDKTKDAEEKETETRVKVEQLQANAFAIRDEREADKEEEEEEKNNEEMKQFGRRVKKTIVKREKNYIYDSDDSNKDPYSESSESEDSETERAKEEEKKKEEAKAATASDREKTKTSKISSGASSRGTNTPSSHPGKHALPSTKSSSSLKRPGSPNLSEASGNESSRKKHKKLNGISSSQSAQPPSRPMSPSLGLPSISVRGGGKSRSNAGSGSEGEGAGSGGEMSDGTKQRIKLKFKNPSKSGTPQMSRAGSPSAPPARTATPANDSSSQAPLPTAEDIRSKIPPEGIRVTELIALYKAQKLNLDGERRTEFIKLMRQNAKFDKETKTLRPF